MARASARLTRNVSSDVFEVLHRCGALIELLPEFAAQPLRLQALHALQQVQQNLPDANTAQRIAALLLPLSSAQANNRATLLKAPKVCQELATLACTLRYSPGMNVTHSQNKLAEQLLETLNAADAWRRPERLQQALQLYASLCPFKTASTCRYNRSGCNSWPNRCRRLPVYKPKPYWPRVTAGQHWARL